MARRPPPGVMTRGKWIKRHPDPSLKQLLSRYIDVLNAIDRWREVGLEPRQEWLCEVGAMALNVGEQHHVE